MDNIDKKILEQLSVNSKKNTQTTIRGGWPIAIAASGSRETAGAGRIYPRLCGAGRFL